MKKTKNMELFPSSVKNAKVNLEMLANNQTCQLCGKDVTPSDSYTFFKGDCYHVQPCYFRAVELSLRRNTC